MSARDLIIGEAEQDDEEADESFDEDTGEVSRKANGTNGANGHLDDSSEEEDDDDPEAARLVGSLPVPPKGLQLTQLAIILDKRRFHCRG